MEVHFTPETEKSSSNLLCRMTADELVRSVIEGYFDELGEMRDALDNRYDALKTGRVKPIPGCEVEAYFREKSGAARRPPSDS